MAALCLDASLETLRPLCCSSTLRLQGDLCRCFHNGSLRGLQAFVTVSARHILQNSPQFIVQLFEVCTPRSNKNNNYNNNNNDNNTKQHWSYKAQKQLSPLHKIESDLAKARQWEGGRGWLARHLILLDWSKSVTKFEKKNSTITADYEGSKFRKINTFTNFETLLYSSSFSQ